MEGLMLKHASFKLWPYEQNRSKLLVKLNFRAERA